MPHNPLNSPSAQTLLTAPKSKESGHRAQQCRDRPVFQHRAERNCAGTQSAADPISPPKGNTPFFPDRALPASSRAPAKLWTPRTKSAGTATKPVIPNAKKAKIPLSLQTCAQRKRLQKRRKPRTANKVGIPSTPKAVNPIRKANRGHRTLSHKTDSSPGDRTTERTLPPPDTLYVCRQAVMPTAAHLGGQLYRPVLQYRKRKPL